MLEKILTAVALLMVIEGILPFLSPSRWRFWMQQAFQLPDRMLRTMGLVSMLLGVGILYLIH